MAQTRAARVIQDTAYLMVSQVIIGIVGLISSAWLARHLPATELAAWPVCITLVAVTYTLSNLGLRDSCVRSVPKFVVDGEIGKAGAMLKTGLALTLFGSILLSLLAYWRADDINSLLLKDEMPVDVVRLLALAVFWTTLATHWEWFLNAFQEYRQLALCRALQNIVRPLAAVGFYWIAGIKGTILGLAFGSVLGCIVSARALLPHWRQANGLMPCGELLRNTLPYYASGIAVGLISRLDYVFVGAIGGAQDLATYFVAFKIAEYVKHFDTYLLDTMTPKIAERAVLGDLASEQTFAKCSRYFFLALLPLHAGLMIISKPLIVLYAGSEYEAAGTILAILCAYLLIDTFYALYRRHIIVLGHRWHPMLLDTFLASLSVVFIGYLSTRIGSVGAALGRVVSVLAVLPLPVVLLERVFRARHSRSSVLTGLLGSLLALGVASVCVRLIGRHSAEQLVVFPLGAFLYLLLLHRRLAPDDLELMQSIIPKRMQCTPVGQRFVGGLKRFYLPHDIVPSDYSCAEEATSNGQ